MWSALVKKVEPSTIADGDIEEVALKVRNGGVVASTIKPYPSIDTNIDESLTNTDKKLEEVESLFSEEDKIPENGQIFLYEELGIKLKSYINGVIENAIISTPTLSDIQVERAIATEKDITVVLNISFELKSNYFDKLSKVLTQLEYIDNPEKLAYGNMDGLYYNDGDNVVNEGWEISGTLYKYNNEPYKIWSESPESNYPSNMDEWLEFATDSSYEKEHIRDRDNLVTHFHIDEYGLEQDSLLVQLYRDVEKEALDMIEVEKSTEVNISTVLIDKTSTTVRLSVVA